MRFKTFPAVLWFVSALIFGSSTVVWAYIPPSGFIVQSLAKKHAGFKNIIVRSAVATLDAAGQPSSLRFKEVTVFYPASGSLRSAALDEKNQVLFETERRGRDLSPLSATLLDPRADVIAHALKVKGVPILTETELNHMQTEEERRDAEKLLMARWNKNVAWVIGTELPSREKAGTPQLWVEKDTFLPVRLIVQGGPLQSSGEDLADFQIEGYRFYREFPYPRTITWMKPNRQPFLRIDLTEIIADTPSDAFKGPAREGFTDAGNALPSSLRDLIRAYYQTVR